MTPVGIGVASLGDLGTGASRRHADGANLLGLAPGALESMGMLGVSLGFDTAFIAALHTARFFLLTLTIPSVALLMGKGGKRM